MDYSIKVGGAAGQGIQTIGRTLTKVLSRSGFHLFSHQDYESRVRGGHNFFQIRFSDKRVFAPRASIDMLIALDRESIPLHGKELSQKGSAIYDSSFIKTVYDDARFIDVPFNDLAREYGTGEIMTNTVASGAALGMLGLDVELLVSVLEGSMRGKSEELIAGNTRAAREGYEYASSNCPRCSFTVEPRQRELMVIEGNDAIALAAIASGCKFYSAYPMTPSTGILNFMAQKAAENGLVVEQAEDEIAAINMVLGASFAGVRAMTGTSGGGFALMVEGLSLAGMTETPIVIALGQRPGPATGLPTRTEQADLLFALYAGHGEFPRLIFAPGTPEQAFKLVNKAFDLTEKYQVPAIILMDQLYADSQWTMDKVDLDIFRYEDYRVRGSKFKDLKEYKRHAFSKTGVSPLAIPGEAKHLVVTDSDEHDEDGHIIEDAETRTRMVQKRLTKKLPLIRSEIGPPELYGSNDPDITLVGWGSTYGVMRDAVDMLSGKNNIAMLHFSELYPFPTSQNPDYVETIRRSRLSVCIENNASGRFATLMRAETGFSFERRINKYDGRPFTLEELMERLDGYIKGL